MTGVTLGRVWDVLIVEDDAAVARVHLRAVSRVRGFRVVGVAATARDAAREIKRARPDLILLDLGLPDQDGITLLRTLRTCAFPIEVIAVTASSASAIVRTALQLGAVDYLVKPFRMQRLHQALEGFARRMEHLAEHALGQAQLDAAIAAPGASRFAVDHVRLDRLEEIAAELAAAGRPLSAAQLGELCSLSRVTARRYLEQLVLDGRATVDEVPAGVGRPTKTYVATR